MKALLAIAIALSALTAKAQPVITAKDITPDAIFTYTRPLGSYLNPDTGKPCWVVVVQRQPDGAFFKARTATDPFKLSVGEELDILPAKQVDPLLN